MKIFNEIRPEEIESGFQQPEPGYEGFILKPTDTYPGDFPRYQEPQPLEPELDNQPILDKEPEISEGIIDASNLEGNIWGTFDQEQPLPTPLAETETAEQPITASIQESIEQEIEEIKELDPFDDLIQTAAKEDTLAPPQEAATLSVDDELRKLLEEELAKSAEKKAKKEATQETALINEALEQQEKPDFVAVEETGDAVNFIDMTNLDPNLPKVDLTQDFNDKPIEIIPKKKSKAKPKQEKVKPPKKEKGEKKPKSVMFWILSSVAGLLIVSVLSYFAFNFYIKSTTHTTKPDSTLAHKDTITHKKEQKKEVEHLNTEQHTDTIPKIEEKPKIEEHRPEITQQETKKTTNESNVQPIAGNTLKPKKVMEPTVVPTTQPTKIEKTPQLKPTKSYEKKPNVASITIPSKPVEIPQQTQEKQIYTIQVYATPSFEDAEFWRQKLTSMKINDVYISTQKVRDVIWYRVRFGKFNNRQQALDVAKQFGFSQTWVDRIQ